MARRSLFRQGDNWIIAGTAAPPKPGEGALKLDAMEVRVDPRENGSRCITKSGASSATSSTIPVCTA